MYTRKSSKGQREMEHLVSTSTQPSVHIVLECGQSIHYFVINIVAYFVVIKQMEWQRKNYRQIGEQFIKLVHLLIKTILYRLLRIVRMTL